MKRDNFVIRWEGREVVKYAWNSAMREVEKIVREIAQQEKCVYRLLSKQTQKDGKEHTSAVIQWGNGTKVVEFIVNKA